LQLTDPAIVHGEGGFSISSRRLEHGITLALTGEVDLSSAPIVEDELLRAESSESLIVLDLEHVSFMDSTGIRTIITADKRLRDRGASLRIVHVPRQVRRLFDLVGISGHLEISEAPHNGAGGTDCC
jgi:anti-sigma B factor antagonist